MTLDCVTAIAVQVSAATDSLTCILIKLPPHHKDNDLQHRAVAVTCSTFFFKWEMFRLGWKTCGPREHLIWPASEFSLPNLDYKSASNPKPHGKQVLKIVCHKKSSSLLVR